MISPIQPGPFPRRISLEARLARWPGAGRLRCRTAVVVVFLMSVGSARWAPTATAAQISPPDRAGAPIAGAPLANAQLARRLSASVYGYLPYWEIDGGTDAYLHYDLLTDIALFSVGFTSTGAISTSSTGYLTVTGSTTETIVAHAHAAGVRVDLTVTSFGFAKNAAFFADPIAMSAASSAISDLVQSEGLDGVNLDVESLYNEDFVAYGVFVGQLRTALRSWNPAAQVSVATNGSLSGTGMANQALANGADRVFIMGYSYRTAGASPAGSISPIIRADGQKSLSWTLDLYAAKSVPADKILLGLPYYGRSWTTTSEALHAPTTGSAGVFIPSDDMAGIPPGTVINLDQDEGSKWFAVRDPGTSVWTQTYFDDPTTLRAKYDLANRRQLGGVGIWTLGYDRGASGYWDAISASFATVRVAGADRYATAAAVAGDAFEPGVETVYIATGASFPDALAAAAVAGSRHSPVLLVTRTGIPIATSAAIQRLHPGRIIVVGGVAAVSDEVLGALGALTSGDVQRVSGGDRYATAVALSAASFPDGAPAVYLASGTGFADALSAAPAAARDGGPVLLASADGLSDATRAELVRLAPSRVVIVGGPSVVGEAVAVAIAGILPTATVSRLSGVDRFGTSAAVAATFDAGVPVVYAASGFGFADALAAAAAAGASASPLVLTGPTTLPDTIRAEIIRLNPSRAVIAGGTAAVADVVLRAIRDAVAAS